MTDRAITILLVEDDEVDVMNVQRAFDRNHITNPIHVAHNGVEALAMLRDGTLPTSRRLVLLDPNNPILRAMAMPGKKPNQPQ